MRHEGFPGKNECDGDVGTVTAEAHASCRIDAIRPGAVSEVGQRGDILLAFAAVQAGTAVSSRDVRHWNADAQNLYRHSGSRPGMTAMRRREAGCQKRGGLVMAIRHGRCDAEYSAGQVGAMPH